MTYFRIRLWLWKYGAGNGQGKKVLKTRLLFCIEFKFEFLKSITEEIIMFNLKNCYVYDN